MIVIYYVYHSLLDPCSIVCGPSTEPEYHCEICTEPSERVWIVPGTLMPEDV